MSNLQNSGSYDSLLQALNPFSWVTLLLLDFFKDSKIGDQWKEVRGLPQNIPTIEHMAILLCFQDFFYSLNDLHNLRAQPPFPKLRHVYSASG